MRSSSHTLHKLTQQLVTLHDAPSTKESMPSDDPILLPGLQTYQEREAVLLAPYAMRSVDSAGRKHAEPEHPYRGPFQRDRDRILHCSAYRRLSGKTQVFTGEMGDYHRTRLTHTQEVASIARTIGRVLAIERRPRRSTGPVPRHRPSAIWPRRRGCTGRMLEGRRRLFAQRTCLDDRGRNRRSLPRLSGAEFDA